MKILTNDPSIRGWGYAVLNENGSIYKVGCIRTEAQNKKNRIRKGDDTTRRIDEICRELVGIIREEQVDYILAELPHGSQNAQAATMIGIATGIIQTISTVMGIGVEWYFEGDAKKALLNKRSATKEETINAINTHYVLPKISHKYQKEAIADAIAIFHAARKVSPVLLHSSNNKAT